MLTLFESLGPPIFILASLKDHDIIGRSDSSAHIHHQQKNTAHTTPLAPTTPSKERASVESQEGHSGMVLRSRRKKQKSNSNALPRMRQTPVENKVVPNKEAVDMFVRGWFFNSSIDHIRRGNIVSWLAWALFYKFPSWLTEDERNELDLYVKRMEQKRGEQFKPGFDTDIKCMRLTLDPLEAIHRPLALY